MWKLVIEDDEGKRTVVPLTREDYTIGRKEGNTIRLTERNVSRDHCRLHKKNGTATPQTAYVLEDMSSYNGVYVNGLRVAQAQDLMHGDLIQIGDYRIVLQDDAVSDAMVTQPMGGGPDEMKSTIPTGVSSQVTRGSLLLERPNRLVMLAGPTPGAEFPLVADRLTLGRAEDAQISVNHNSVSRLHCEIHALGEGRFEIVDKGSSNGVRVNGADLRRGIIEAGDIIELGDVKFKFVGAGQIFLPGVNDSAQLEAIGERTTNAVAPRKGSSIVAWVLFGAALAAVGTVGVVYKQKMRAQQLAAQSAAQATPDTHDDDVLAEAKAQCNSTTTAGCEAAHKAILGIPTGSPLRASEDFKLVVAAWADDLINRATNSDVELAAKRAMLQQVINDPMVDDTRRKSAREHLDQLETTGSTTGPVAAISTTMMSTAPATGAAPAPTPPTVAPHDGGGTRSGSGTAAASQRTTPAPSETHRPTPTSTTSSGGGSVADRARNMMLNDPSGARALLEPRVASGRATRDEVGLLKIICHDQHDTVCVEHCKQLLGQ